jgi:hypothetical protein
MENFSSPKYITNKLNVNGKGKISFTTTQLFFFKPKHFALAVQFGNFRIYFFSCSGKLKKKTIN